MHHVVTYRHLLTLTCPLQRPWLILLQFRGSIWASVIPYCVFNCCLTYLIYFLESKAGVRITFSGQAHALMSLIVSYLVVSKVYLSLERYMISRTWAGHALTALRELNQLVLTFSEGQSTIESRIWRREVSGAQRDGHDIIKL